VRSYKEIIEWLALNSAVCGDGDRVNRPCAQLVSFVAFVAGLEEHEIEEDLSDFMRIEGVE